MRFELDADQRALVELAEEVLRREEGNPAHIWKALVDAGVLGAVLPEQHGGSGLGVFEAGLLAQAIARAGADVPVFGSLFLAALPLAAQAGAAQPEELDPLPRSVIEDGAILTAAIGEPSTPFPVQPRTVTRAEGDRLRVRGTKINVPELDQAARLLITVTHEGAPAVVLVDANGEGVRPGPRGSLHLEDAPVVRVLGGAELLRSVHEHALAGAAALADGALAGALDLTVTHIGTREQFGRPIATFQAAAAQVADVYIAARAMHLIAFSACWRLGNGLAAATDLAAAGYWLAARTVEAVHTCHHLHGGIGVDMDYPLHRYYGKLTTLTGFLGGGSAATEAIGGLAGAEPVVERREPGPGVELELSPKQQELRAELRAYLATLITPEQREQLRVQRHGDAHREVVRRLGADGWLGVGWPPEYGGRGVDPIEQAIFVNEAARADVQLPSVTLQTVAPTLLANGTEEQREFFLPKILAGQLHFAIGYSEPEAGTDLASLRTTAVRDGDEYVINGQKMFTTGVHEADYIWLAVRTDREAPKHKGISVLIVDTRDPGFSHTPIITCDGAHHVNACYFNDVRVPVNRLVGEENKGWRLITTQLNHERVMLGPHGYVGAQYDRVRDWALARGLLGEPDVRAGLGEVLAVLRINELLNWQVAASHDGSVGDACATKVFGSTEMQRVGRLLNQILARHGDPGDPETAELAAWLDMMARRNLVLTFGGGVNEVQRELIAQFGLGLPRVPR